MMEKGIMDCFLIVKTALEDAISIGKIFDFRKFFAIKILASMVLTTEVLVVDENIYIRKISSILNVVFDFFFFFASSQTLESLPKGTILIFRF